MTHNKRYATRPIIVKLFWMGETDDMVKPGPRGMAKKNKKTELDKPSNLFTSNFICLIIQYSVDQL